MTSPTGLVLAGVHDASQARLLDAALAEAALALEALLDGRDVDRTERAYLATVTEIVSRQRGTSAALGAEFYETLRLVEGAQGSYAARLPEAPPPVVLETSLRVVGPVAVKAATAKGATVPEALDVALTRTLGAVTRLVEAGGRTAVMLNSLEDRSGRGWVRRSGGSPCDFCALLISRGPVYTSRSGFGTNTRTGLPFAGDAPNRFRAHDHCHCRAVPFFAGDSGWTTQSAEYRVMWDSSGGDRATFRRLLRAKHGAPKSPDGVIDAAADASRSSAQGGARLAA